MCAGMLALRPGVGATGRFPGSTKVNKLMLARRPNKNNTVAQTVPVVQSNRGFKRWQPGISTPSTPQFDGQ